MTTRPESVDVLFDELAKTTGQDPRLDAHVDRLKPQLDDFETIQYRARKVAEDVALGLQGSLLVRHGHPAVAEAFLATRMHGQWGGAYGTMPDRSGSGADYRTGPGKGMTTEDDGTRSDRSTSTISRR